MVSTRGVCAEEGRATANPDWAVLNPANTSSLRGKAQRLGRGVGPGHIPGRGNQEVVKKLDRCGKELSCMAKLLIYQFVIQLRVATKVADFRGQNQVDPESGWTPQGHLPLKVF